MQNFFPSSLLYNQFLIIKQVNLIQIQDIIYRFLYLCVNFMIISKTLALFTMKVKIMLTYFFSTLFQGFSEMRSNMAHDFCRTLDLWHDSKYRQKYNQIPRKCHFNCDGRRHNGRNDEVTTLYVRKFFLSPVGYIIFLHFH